MISSEVADGAKTPQGLATPTASRDGSSSPSGSVVDSTTAASKPTEASTRPPAYCYMLAGIACLNSCNLGYDIGSVGGAALLMREQMGWTMGQQSIFIGCINFFSIIGALNASLILDRLGRCRSFVVSSCVFITGLVVQMLSHSFLQAMVGRFLVGLGVGLGLAIDPLYISEVSPPAFRGHLVSFSEISLTLGIMLGYVADAAFLGLPPGANWRFMLGLGIAMPSLLIALCLTVMPESPRWLIMMGRAEEAVPTLTKSYPPGTDVPAVIQEIEDMIEADRAADVVGWHAVLCPSKPVRLMLLAGVGLTVCQQLSGCEGLVYFSPETLASAGFTSRTQQFQLTILVGAVKTLFTFVSTFKADQYGRRPLLLSSTTGIFFSLVAMAYLSGHQDLAPYMLVAMCSFMAFFALAMGPVCWIGVAEVFPTRIRAKALSIATSLNRLASGSVAASTLPLRKWLGIQYFFVFYSVLTVLTGLYLYTFFPETKGKSLEEIEEYFHVKAGVGAVDHHRQQGRQEEEGRTEQLEKQAGAVAASTVEHRQQ